MQGRAGTRRLLSMTRTHALVSPFNPPTCLYFLLKQYVEVRLSPSIFFFKLTSKIHCLVIGANQGIVRTDNPAKCTPAQAQSQPHAKTHHETRQLINSCRMFRHLDTLACVRAAPVDRPMATYARSSRRWESLFSSPKFISLWQGDTGYESYDRSEGPIRYVSRSGHNKIPKPSVRWRPVDPYISDAFGWTLASQVLGLVAS